MLADPAETMGYKQLLVHMALGQSHPGLLQVALQLSRRWDARLVGLAACQPAPRIAGAGYVDATLIAGDTHERHQELAAAEALFRETLTPYGVDLSWRSNPAAPSLTDYLAHEARCADLVLVASDAPGPFDGSRSPDMARLLRNIGRPVLIVPPQAERMDLDRVLVAWRDTQQAQRAVAQALPLLQAAAQVTVVEVVYMTGEDGVAVFEAARARVADVAAWLQTHGVRAQHLAKPAQGDAVQALHSVIETEGSDLVVAGAYSHSALREWAFGGVSRDLLVQPDRCTLVSH